MRDLPREVSIVSGTPIHDVAVVVGESDNVAVVKFGIDAGTKVILANGKSIRTAADIGAGHRFATLAIPGGDYVRQYDQPIGTSRGLAPGDPVTEDSMSNDIPVVRELPADLDESGTHVPA